MVQDFAGSCLLFVEIIVTLALSDDVIAISLAVHQRQVCSIA